MFSYRFVFLMIVVFFLVVGSCTKLTELTPNNRVGVSDNSSQTVSILMPTNGQIFSSNVVMVVGNASDEGSGVKEVLLRLGSSGDFGKVSGTTNWFTNLSGLVEGVNEVYVYV